MSSERMHVGISACLLGHKVRYDGGHQLDQYIARTLGRYMDFVHVCPEVECGLPIPREALRLVGDPAMPRLVTRESRVDHTERMRAWAERKVEELSREELSGFIFKSRSPSSGMERVKVYPEGGGQPVLKGAGIFPRLFMERFPLLPVEDDGRLHDPALRENFIERLFVMHAWQSFQASSPSLGGLVSFHTKLKLQLMAHSRKHYDELGRLVAHGKELALPELLARYARTLMEGLRIRATPRKHANVLQHILGHFKKELAPDEKQEALELIEHYRQGNVPLIVPVTLLNHFVRKYDKAYLAEQYYLRPHPLDLRLRNEI
ncbi:DUF523 and DUF1722 domain-containing protein [Desulfocurvibacter africanus]|uniref:YbgA family protein n=1 Tax=Desulfocurvibacter africanus TaxID=873 RepID=UPI002FD8D065